MTASLDLEVRKLNVDIRGPDGLTEILTNVNLTAHRGEVLGIVGETGSGKTMTMRAVLGVLPPQSRMSGTIGCLGKSFEPDQGERKHLLGREITTVFQDARSSLHPTTRIGRQLTWAMQSRGKGLSKTARAERARQILRDVGLKGSETELASYPFQLSGGMCQRAALGMALAAEPRLLIADEPTSALDATVQLQIADLLRQIVGDRELTLILITHDIRLVRYLCDAVVIMREGKVIEHGRVQTILPNPTEEYTRLLLAAST